jgi:hypothetical protein
VPSQSPALRTEPLPTWPDHQIQRCPASLLPARSWAENAWSQTPLRDHLAAHPQKMHGPASPGLSGRHRALVAAPGTHPVFNSILNLSGGPANDSVICSRDFTCACCPGLCVCVSVVITQGFMLARQALSQLIHASSPSPKLLNTSVQKST